MSKGILYETNHYVVKVMSDAGEVNEHGDTAGNYGVINKLTGLTEHKSFALSQAVQLAMKLDSDLELVLPSGLAKTEAAKPATALSLVPKES